MDRSIDDGCIKTQKSTGDYLKKAAFISVILFLVSMGGVGAVPVTGCGTLSTAGETYVLQNDISTSGTCFTIGADNIVLDGAGYSITGDGEGDGVSLSSKRGVTVKNLNVSGFWNGIYLPSSSNNTLINNTASNNSKGIYLPSSSNNTLINNTASNNSYGIYFWYSSNNTLTSNTASNNSYGIYLQASSNNTLINNTMSANSYNFDISGSFISHHIQTIGTDNTVDGKPIYYLVDQSNVVVNSSTNAGFVGAINSDNITVEGLTLTKNGLGVLFVNTTNSSVLNVNTSNNFVGIHFDFSGNNILTGNTVSNNNGYGIWLWNSSNYNTLTNNTISNNGGGIRLYESSSNAIYNNFFNNNTNTGFSGTIYPNDWNTTKTPGTNIIGGPYLGGNFWAKPDGTGFSDTCTDADGDGICDSSYTLASGNVDYLPLAAKVVEPQTITVCPSGCDYTSIQAAVDAANNGDTINVGAGTYTENIDVAKSVNIIGAGADVTIANASNPDDHVFYVTADSVNISGFTVTGATSSILYRGGYLYSTGIYLNGTGYGSISNNIVSNNYRGIYFQYSNNNVITGNTANSNTLYGVWLFYSNNNVIANNTASNNSAGITLYSSNNTLTNNTANSNGDYGIVLGRSNNTLTNNTASNNSNGIYLRYSSNNTLTNNIVNSNTWYGISLSSSGSNTLTDNTASANGKYGISLSSSSSNLIYNNYFSNVNNSNDDSTNYWNTTKTAGTNIAGGPYLGGNYWSDYTGTDTDGDGIGDNALPYNANGAILNGGDQLPLISTAPITYYNISLNSGWNLVSIPLEQDDWSIEAVLASIEGNYTGVYAFIDGIWKYKLARNPLTKMDLEHGYWIEMTAPDTLELNGTVPPATTINVTTGWNLVGYPSLTTRNITDVLAGINYTAVYAYIGGSWKFTTARNPLTEMTPGYGYWIDSNEAASYEV